ncbi:MAG: AMIN domain-containing protein, partial [Gammaproteobacteria bacterium]|nr:AMIN domain-containing protein [Gammaproteobacteria bacterium]
MSINNTSTLNFQQRTATMLEPNHMKFTPFKALVIAFILLGGNNLFAQDIILQDINYSNLDDNNIQIVLTLSGKAPKPGIFTIDNPARLAIDLPNTAMGLNKKSQQIDSSIARSIRAVEAGGRTRVVLNLNHMAPYDVVTDGNLIYINIGMDNAVSPTVVSTSPTEAQSELSGRTFSGKSISNINFHRSDSGGGKITVSLSDPSTIIDLQERAGKLVINFIGAHVPEKMERRLNVKDFATPVTAIDTYSREGNAHMVITAQGSYEHIAYQTGNTYTIDITPPKQTKGGTVDKKPEYTGERLSLNFQDIDVRAILQLLADFTSLNVIVSDSVQGNLTLRLKNVPWDHALDIILKTKGLAMRETGNVILIAPSAEIAAREKLELESQKQLEELAPLYTQYFEISYAKAAEIAALLKAEANSLLSSRGNVSIDDRTNTLMVLDTQDKIEDIQKLVDKLDIPIRQVLIESRIVIANDDYTRNLGVTL